MSEKEEDYFLQNIKGVQPIKRKNQIRKKIKKIHKNIIEKDALKKENKTTEQKTEKQQSTFSIIYGSINKKLKSGKILIDKKIDFHGKTLIEAESIFNRAVLECYKKKQRCILFVTGKGLNKKNHLGAEPLEHNPKLFYGKIREAFLGWVKRPEFAKHILTVERANLENGGDGAFFVYLRKKPIQLKP